MAGNFTAGVNTGMQGAQLGANFGPQGALIGGIAGFALGFQTPDYEKIAREKYNSEVLKNFAKSLFDTRKVQNIENMRTAQALAAYQDNLRVQGSSYNAQYGAADMIGSSTTALKQAMDFQTQEAKRGVLINWETQIDNMNTSIDAMANQSMAGLRRTKGDTRQMDYAGLVKTGLDLYGQYRNTFNNPNTSTTQLGINKIPDNMSDFGSYGKSGSMGGFGGSGSLFG